MSELNREIFHLLAEANEQLEKPPTPGERVASIERRHKLAEYAMLRAQLLILRAQHDQVLYPLREVR